MKTIAINGNSNLKNNNVAFKGHSAQLVDTGVIHHKFFMPFDSNKYSAEFEIRGFKEDKGDWVPATEPKVIPFTEQGLSVKESSLFGRNYAVGYRFVFKDKSNPNNKIYKIDSGVVSNPLSSSPKDNYSILLKNRSMMPENKLTKQVMPDLLPGYSMETFNDNTYEIYYDKDARLASLEQIRNHGNKLGGNFAGIIKMLPLWSKEGYTKLVGTPFTKDEVSSHLYWTENPYQVSSAMGTADDFKAFQLELFKNGMNFVADGAFVNQGLQGTMFKHVLKHGLSSPFLYWFKAPGLLDGSLKLGIIPEKEKAREHFRFKLVNLPVRMVMDRGELVLLKNKDFDPKQLSYVQVYDDRLVDEADVKKANILLKKYNQQNTKSPYEITDHNDLTQLLTFEVDPQKYTERLKKVFDKTRPSGKNFSNDAFVESVLKFPNFMITTKDKGGVDLWDGNMDIAKLNFYIGNTDQLYSDKLSHFADRTTANKNMRRGAYQVQDFTIKAGKYWTKMVADAQFDYVLKMFKKTKPTVEAYMETIRTEVQKGNLPKSTEQLMTKEVIQNILDGYYVTPYTKFKPISKINEFAEFSRRLLMEESFASYEFSPDLSAVMMSPYITRYAENEGGLSESRYDDYINHLAGFTDLTKDSQTKVRVKMDEYLYKDVAQYVCQVLDHINYSRRKTEPDSLTHDKVADVTDIAKYMFPLVVPEIVKYVIIKSLNPEANVYVNDKTGEVRFDSKSFSELSLKSLGISGSPEEEATAVINKLKAGTKRLLKDDDAEKLAEVLKRRFQNVSIDKLRVTEAIIDRTQAGLGWRIDAAKDIGNIDAIRSGNDNPERLLNILSSFWGRFNDAVKSVNRNAYTTAEITDFDAVVKQPCGDYKNEVDAETKFIERSGLNNTANYMFFFSLLRDMFAIDAEEGYQKGELGKIESLRNKLVEGWEPKCHGFLYQYPEDSIANSYTFIGNHDKPRVLHLFALDMGLFHSDFSSFEHVERAAKVLGYGSQVDKIDMEKLSGKAVAMGERILDALEETGLSHPKLSAAVASLANGDYKGEPFNAEAFGVRDIRFVVKDVFDIAEYKGYEPKNRAEEENAVLESILTPAMDKMETVYKMLVTLPGSPTDFVGDKEGSTGYESKSNNQYQQNRNVVPFEWVNGAINMREYDGEEKEFVKNYYLRMNKIGSLRNSRNLSALNNGDTISLPLQEAKSQKVDKNGNNVGNAENTKVAATFRYNDKGSQVICLYTTAGAASVLDEKGYQLDETSPKTSRIKMQRPRVDLDKIVLSDDSNWKSGLKAGLKVGDIFRNVNDPCAKYVVAIENGQYVLKNADSRYNISILPEDKNTAVLYKYEPNMQQAVPAHFVLRK